MNIIIVGCGKIGQTLAEELIYEDDINITVIDMKSNVINDITGNIDVMGFVGNGASIDTLMQAGIKDTDILIAVTGSDELNLLTCLIAKKMGNCQTIARVRKPEYSKELHLFKEDLGLAMIINPEQTAASEIARALRFPSAIQIDTFAKGRIEILKFRIPLGSVLDGLRIADMSQKIDADVLVCGVERDNEVYIPGGDFVLKSGDFISIVSGSNHSNGSDFFKKINVNTNSVKDAIIVGGGATAFYLAKRLLDTGIKVKIIEQKPERCAELCDLLPKATIINADGTDNRVLLEEGIERAESFVALTNIDEENILLSLFAKTKTNGKLVTKINRIAYDNVIENLDLDTTVYPKYITAEYIVRFVRAKNNSISSEIETLHHILDGKVEALEFKIKENSPIIGTTLEDLPIKKNTLIACIVRGGELISPRGKDEIMAGDTVIVVTTNTGYREINDILEKKK